MADRTAEALREKHAICLTIEIRPTPPLRQDVHVKELDVNVQWLAKFVESPFQQGLPVTVEFGGLAGCRAEACIITRHYLSIGPGTPRSTDFPTCTIGTVRVGCSQRN
jgi:hypothetical protein